MDQGLSHQGAAGHRSDSGSFEGPSLAYLGLTEAQLVELGRLWGKDCQGGEVFFLQGQLGAGKTRLAKSIGAGLGIDPAEMQSPSFTLVHRHQAGGLILYHVDLYRLEPGDQQEIGLDEIFQSDTVVIIEWPERVPAIHAYSGVWVDIRYSADENRRDLWIDTAKEAQ